MSCFLFLLCRAVERECVCECVMLFKIHLFTWKLLLLLRVLQPLLARISPSNVQ